MTQGRPSPTLRDVGEDGLIAAIVARYPPAPPWLELGPGDDAAVLAPLQGRLVVSTDAIVEGEDFLTSWSSGHDVGVKLAAQNLADVAAMGARPLGLVVTLAAPADREVAWAVDVASGLADECARAGAAVIGGDLSAGPVVMLTATALGVLEVGTGVRRDGARPGDVVAVTPGLGEAAAGLQLLLDGRLVDAHAQRVAERVKAAQRSPRPPYPAGVAAAAAGATAMIDTSDGLVRDATRIARASGAVLDLDPAALSGDVEALRPVARDEEEALDWVMSGGEDHAMLACFPDSDAVPEPFRVIGRVLSPGRADAGGAQAERAQAGGAQAERAQADRVLFGGRPWTGAQGWLHWR